MCDLCKYFFLHVLVFATWDGKSKKKGSQIRISLLLKITAFEGNSHKDEKGSRDDFS